MTMTVNSGAASFCTGAQFVTIFDWRTFAQLASDTDVPLASSAALQSSAVLTACLQIGAGNIEMAATVSARYDPDDLTALVSPAVTNGGWALIQMNALLGASEMYARRFEAMPERIAIAVAGAQEKLAALEEGAAIFSFAETQQAGLTQDYKETATDVEKRNLPSFVARRCFGRRANRLPYG